MYTYYFPSLMKWLNDFVSDKNKKHLRVTNRQKIIPATMMLADSPADTFITAKHIKIKLFTFTPCF